MLWRGREHLSLDEGVPRTIYIMETQVVLSPCPDFCKDFVLETDASIRGLGAVLSQTQSDGKLHPIAFASRALSPLEKNYAVTKLETLAVHICTDTMWHCTLITQQWSLLFSCAIRESVDSLCTDGTNEQYMQYLTLFIQINFPNGLV